MPLISWLITSTPLRATFACALLLGVLSIRAWGVEIKYPVRDIPESLISANYAIVREEVYEFKLLTVSKSAYYVREAITILNPNGNFLARKALDYDPSRKIQILNAAIYNADGYLVRKIKNSEIKDQSAFDGFSLYSDNRVKLIDMSQNSYPYTVLCEYEVSLRQLYYIPPFVLFEDDEVGIQEKSFSVIYPENLTPRYKLINAPEPELKKDGTISRLTWSFRNMKPDPWEKYSDPMTSVTKVLVAPTEFEYDGYAGKMDTWENLGKWQQSLNDSRGVLPPQTTLKISDLTAGKSDREKIRILYEYLQNKTRYVSIQLGIGGLQPAKAEVVDQLGYGDCKALSNYMITLLKAAGIKGYYTTIYAGNDYDGGDIADFPSHFGNHVIVAVPLETDTVWLECTNQTSPFNYLGTFTGDRYALMITEQGGKMVRTPAYDREVNTQVTRATITLDHTGKGQAQIRIVYNGTMYDHKQVGSYAKLGTDKQKEWIEKGLEVSAFNLNSFAIKTVSGSPQPAAEVTCQLFLPNCAAVQGKRLFLQGNLLNKAQPFVDKSPTRKTDIRVKFPYTKVDSIEYILPRDISPEFVPEPVSIISPFGSYEASYKIAEGRLIYVRRFMCNNGTFSKEKYPDFLAFYKAVNRADYSKLVFLTKT